MTEADFRTRQRREASDDGVTAIYADALYDQWRDDALAMVSASAPMATSTSLAIVAGTKNYALPSDWITSTSTDEDADGYPSFRLEDADGAYHYIGEHFTVYGRTLKLASAPVANGTWTHYYGGTWTVALLPNDWVPIALDAATVRAFDRRATDGASKFDFSVGPDSVTRGNESKRWTDLRDARLERVTAALATIATTGGDVTTFRISRS